MPNWPWSNIDFWRLNNFNWLAIIYFGSISLVIIKSTVHNNFLFKPTYLLKLQPQINHMLLTLLYLNSLVFSIKKWFSQSEYKLKKYIRLQIDYKYAFILHVKYQILRFCQVHSYRTHLFCCWGNLNWRRTQSLSFQGIFYVTISGVDTS